MGRLHYEACSGDRLGFSKGSRNIMRVFRMRRTVVLCPSLIVTGLWLGHSEGPTLVGDTSQSIVPILETCNATASNSGGGPSKTEVRACTIDFL